MLLAVEGGRFFSSSASGYSKGLTLLLLRNGNEDRRMRVSPWNQYQLVDQESESDLQLASTKNCLARGCTSFVCFSRASAGLDCPSPVKEGPARLQNVSPGLLVSNEGQNSVHLDENVTKIALKSSLRKQRRDVPIPVEVNNEHETACGQGTDAPTQTERRKVQWTDACGSELAEIREFEPSETDGSDDELEKGNERSCSCAIM